MRVIVVHNPASQITSTTRTGDVYAWTEHGNGDTNYKFNNLDELTEIEHVAVGNDSKGNLTSEPQSGRTYGYSSENLLTAASGGATLSYDPALRLYQVAGASTTRFAYDGTDMIAEYDGTNALQRRYVFGPGVDDPIVQYEGAGTADRRFMSADERGSIISLSDNSGAMLNINRYDEYGKPQSTNVGRFQYTGQMWLSEVGAYYYKARMYLPHLGRFMQTDPIGYGDGPNLYAYVGNDPVNRVDPLGLEQAIVITAQVPIVITAPSCPDGWSCSEPGSGGSGGEIAGIDQRESIDAGTGEETIVITAPVIPIVVTAPSKPPFVAVALPQHRTPPPYSSVHNYCGGEGSIQLPRGNWNEACYHHDICYGTVGSVKSSCDLILFLEIYNSCKSKYGDRFCTGVALIGFILVDRAGYKFYDPTHWNSR